MLLTVQVLRVGQYRSRSLVFVEEFVRSLDDVVFVSSTSLQMSTFFASGPRDEEDPLRCMASGSRRFVFLAKGPLRLVAITSRLQLPYKALETLLDRVHRQFTTIVTASVEKELMRRPNFDVRNQLVGTEHVVSNLVRWCFNDMLLLVDGRADFLLGKSPAL